MRAVLAALGLALAAAAGHAAEPSFDCAKAEGAAEALVCRDAALADLDRALHGVYEAALRSAIDEPGRRRLVAEQRGWGKGRNDCWKAEDLRGCVDREYRQRTVELQARYRLVPSRGPVFWRCGPDAREEVVTTFFETSPPSAVFERGDRSIVLTLEPAGSGARYVGPDVVFWTRADEARFEPYGEDPRACAVQEPAS